MSLAYSVFALGVLETQYNPEMTTEEGVKLVVQAINTALQRDSCSGNGIDVIVISEKEIKRVMHKEIQVSL